MVDGYPYLHIARKYGLPYEQVLAAADYIIHQRGPTPDVLPQDKMLAAAEIAEAAIQFRRIQGGEIDWQTGSPIPRPLDS